MIRMIRIIILHFRKEYFMGKEPTRRMLENRITERLKRIREVKPFITDALTRITRKCGNPACRCADGEKHPAYLLTYKEKGKTLMANPKGSQRASTSGLKSSLSPGMRTRLFIRLSICSGAELLCFCCILGPEINSGRNVTALHF
jgi:hypothetical protein